jgi:DNA modification methylase
MKKGENFKKENKVSQVVIEGSNFSSYEKTVNENNVFKVDITKVEPHPSVMKVYQPKNLNGLKLTLTMAGQLEPIMVVKRGEMLQIVNGISRYLAILELGWETITVKQLDYSDEEILEQFVLRNYRPKRSFKELCDHAEIILGILGLSQGKKRDKIGDLSIDNEDFGLVGKDRFEIACEIIGAEISASSLRRSLEIKEFEENGDDEIKGFQLMEKIEKGEMRINQAVNVITNYKSSKKEQGSNALTEAIEVIKGGNFQLYNKSCEDLNDIPDESVDCVVDSPPYYQQREYPDGVRDMEQPQHGLEKTVDEYVRKEIEINCGVYRKLKKTGSLFIVISDSFRDGKDCLVVEKLILEMVNSGWSLIQKIYWLCDAKKPQSDLVKRLMPTYEYILHFCKEPKSYFYREFRIWKEGDAFNVSKGSKDSGMGHKMKNHTWWLQKPLVRFRNFLSEQKVKQVLHANGFNWSELKDIDPNFRHMAPFPSVIPLLPILLTTKIGDTVLDIYNGTSTTTAVALQLGRKVIGYDTDTESHLFASKRLRLVEENLPTNQEVIEFENEFMKDIDDQELIAA